MSDLNTVTVPAHIAARVAARKADEKKSSVMSAIVGGDGFPYPKVSIRAGRYRLVEDGVETTVGINLDVVIVGANPRVGKIFYAKPYDPNAQDMRPDCFSNDGLKPDASVQSPVSESCQNCSNNVLGSKITPSGAKSKLCADQRQLAVVPAADPSKVYALTIPVSGMKGLREYFKSLNNFNLIPEEVVTELGFDESTSYPKITFNHKGFVPEKAMPKIEQIVGSDEVQEVIRVKPLSNRPQIAAPAAAAAPKIAAPAVDEAYEEEAAAPAPAKASKPKKDVETPPVEAASSELEAKLDSIFADD